MVSVFFGIASCVWLVDPCSDAMSDVSWFKLLAFIIGGRSGVNVTSDGWFNVSLWYFFKKIFLPSACYLFTWIVGSGWVFGSLTQVSVNMFSLQ